MMDIFKIIVLQASARRIGGHFSKNVFARRKTIQYQSFTEKTIIDLAPTNGTLLIIRERCSKFPRRRTGALAPRWWGLFSK